jgi:hypothetical protein
MRRRDPLTPRLYASSQLYARAPQDVMSVGEILQWLTLLHEQHGWPWETLGRTLGIGEGKHVRSKIRGNSWIGALEQRRMSRQLCRIISGELVLIAPNKYGRRDAVIADNLRPIRGALHMAINWPRSARIVWRTAPLPEPSLPSFKNALAKFFDPPLPDTDQ